MNTRCEAPRLAVVLSCFATAVVALVLPGLAADTITEQLPDVVVVGWNVDDTPDGNGDGGLHPGETAFLEIYLSNRGNEPARGVTGTLFEVENHPDVAIEAKFASWPDLPATGAPAASFAPHVRIRVTANRPCMWEIPLRLEIDAAGGYSVAREFTLVMVDPRRVDLAEGAGRPFYYGVDDEDELGAAVASCDVDGDGFDDLVAGAPLADGPTNGRALAGEVALIYGHAGAAHDRDLSFPEPDVAFVYGADGGDGLGNSVGCGDMNGDGYDDLILGAPNSDGPADARSGAGEVAVVYGGPTRLSDIDLNSPSPLEVFIVYGADTFDGLGLAVGAGDVDGDGFDDLLLAADGGDGPGNGRIGSGELAIVYGDSYKFTDVHLNSPAVDVTMVYGPDSDEIGDAVASGDLDGDGFDDLIVGAVLGDGAGRFNSGTVSIVYGGSSMPAQVDLNASPSGTFVVAGAGQDDNLGSAVATGDLDGDGHDDLVLGAPRGDGLDDTGDTVGEVALVYGGPSRLVDIDLASPPSGVALIYGSQNGDSVGTAVATGDVDADGFDDAILCGDGVDGPAGVMAGAAAVVHGGDSRLTAFDLASAPPDTVVVFGADVNDRLGTASFAGDVNGDGYDDLLLGSYFADGPDDTRTGAGEVAVVPGAPRGRYRWDDDAFAFITAAVDSGLACDDCSVRLPIGFEFDFFGRRHDTVEVSSNGYLTFADVGNRPSGLCPPWSGNPNDIIAVFWDDLNLEVGGGVYYLLEGVPPNRRFTVEWRQVPLYPAIDGATFEVTLFETSNQILFQYQDVEFGGTPSDNGGQAVIGVESASGANGTPRSCYTPAIPNLSAVRWRRFADPTVIQRDDFDNGHGVWTGTGFWTTVSNPACAPASRSGDSGWYYGQIGTCNYDNAAPNLGTLTRQPIPMPQDASLAFWHRRETDGGTDTDLSLIRASTDGVNFAPVAQVMENSGGWLFTDDFMPIDGLAHAFAPIDLSSYAGQDVWLRLRFDTIDAVDNAHLGWMVDDIQVRGCPVWSGGGSDGAASEARATAQPDVYCETASGRLDALGSYCTACATLSYQWSENGAPIPGATGVVYDIPPGKAPAGYAYTVAIDCASSAQCADESDVAPVTIVAFPDEVGPTLTVERINSGADLEFHWADVAGADDYGLFSDTDPAGGFANETGSSSSGAAGVTVPTPPGEIVFYLVAGRNPICGPGPK